MKHFLSQEEREEFKIQHKKERDKRICDRIKAVLGFLESLFHPPPGIQEALLSRITDNFRPKARALLIRIVSMLVKMTKTSRRS